MMSVTRACDTPARCRRIVNFSAASRPEMSAELSGSSVPARHRVGQRTFERVAALDRRRDRVRGAVDDAREATGAGEERAPRERSEERHAGQHGGVIRERHAVMRGEPAELRAVIRDQRLVRGDDRHAGGERLPDDCARRLESAQDLDEDVEAVHGKRLGRHDEANRRRMPRLRDVSHERTDERQSKTGLFEALLLRRPRSRRRPGRSGRSRAGRRARCARRRAAPVSHPPGCRTRGPDTSVVDVCSTSLMTSLPIRRHLRPHAGITRIDDPADEARTRLRAASGSRPTVETRVTADRHAIGLALSAPVSGRN